MIEIIECATYRKLLNSRKQLNVLKKYNSNSFFFVYKDTIPTQIVDIGIHTNNAIGEQLLHTILNNLSKNNAFDDTEAGLNDNINTEFP